MQSAWVAAAAACLLQLLVLVSVARAQPYTRVAGFQLDQMPPYIPGPINVKFPGDGKIIVGQKQGTVVVLDSWTSAPYTLLDFQPQVNVVNDRGLLGLALDPKFLSGRPYLYAFYTYDPTRTHMSQCPPDGSCASYGRLSRWRLNIGAKYSLASGEQVIIGGEQMCHEWGSHSAGAIHFDQYGGLLVPNGDGSAWWTSDYGMVGPAGFTNPCKDPPSQNLVVPTSQGGSLRSQSYRFRGSNPSLDGCVLRINPDTGNGMPENPLFSSASPGSGRSQLLACGLRNPYRSALRPGTNELWLGDVGQDTWEEINVIKDIRDRKMRNFGWPCFEGTPQQPAFSQFDVCKSYYPNPSSYVPPLYSYRHGTAPNPSGITSPFSGSVSGMAFYSGTTYPTQYRGALFFGDYSQQGIWAMLPTNGVPDPAKIVTIVDQTRVASIESGPNNDLYIVDYGRNYIYRLRYVSNAPSAALTCTPTSGNAPLKVTCNAGGSKAGAAGGALSYSWDLNGDGTFGDSAAVATASTTLGQGTHKVTVRVTGTGGTSTASVTITVVASPEDVPYAVITSPTATFKWDVGMTVNYAGRSTVAGSTLKWDAFLRHCPVGLNSCHSHDIMRGVGGASGSFIAPQHEMDTYIIVTLTVSKNGITNSKSVNIYPNVVDITIDSSPRGISITFGSLTEPTPFVVKAVVGGTLSLIAPGTSGNHKFSKWSDNGGLGHSVKIGTTNAAYTATYTTVAGPPPSSGGAMKYAVNCGKESAGGFTDTAGFAWSSETTAAQQHYTGFSESNEYLGINRPMANVDRGRQQLMFTERFGEAFSYDFPVTNGGYFVTMYFTETYWTAAGKRSFDVSIEGVKVLSKFDTYAAAGAKDTAVKRQFSTKVSDGKLTVAFNAYVDKAHVNGIMIQVLQ
eukprot:jgi/Chlat1/1874/Chrsp143S02198